MVRDVHLDRDDTHFPAVSCAVAFGARVRNKSRVTCPKCLRDIAERESLDRLPICNDCGAAIPDDEGRCSWCGKRRASPGSKRLPAEQVLTVLPADKREAIGRYLHSPTKRSWDRILGIRIGHDVLWAYIVSIDPRFPKFKRSFDGRGNIVYEWGRIPSKELVVEALALALKR